MKLSVFAVLLADKSLDEACKYLAQSGVQAIEIGCGGFPGKAHCNPEELLKDETKIQEFKATIEKYGLEIAALSTHGNAVHPGQGRGQGLPRRFRQRRAAGRKAGRQARDHLLRLPRRKPRGQDPQLGHLPLAGRFLRHLGLPVERGPHPLLEEDRRLGRGAWHRKDRL